MSEQKKTLMARMQALKRKETKKKAKVDVDQVIHDRAKAYAEANGLTIVQVFEEIMSDGLDTLECAR